MDDSGGCKFQQILDQLSVDIRSSVRLETTDNEMDEFQKEFSPADERHSADPNSGIREVNRYSVDSRLIREYVIKEMQEKENKEELKISELDTPVTNVEDIAALLTKSPTR